MLHTKFDCYLNERKKTTTLLFLDILMMMIQKKMIQNGTQQSIYKRILLNAKFCGVFS